VFRFLGVREDFRSRGFDRAHNVTRSKRKNSRPAMWLGRPTRALPPKIGWRIRKLLTYPLSRPLPRRPELEEPTRARLVERLAADVDALRDFCGRDFEWWSL
jgi:hypothetical protein